MRILAIDPGPEKSAAVVYQDREILWYALADNQEVKDLIIDRVAGDSAVLAVEMVACYGMPVGQEVFETCVWIGRFMEAFQPDPHYLVYRREVKLHLCGTAQAKDSNIRQALIDRFGGKEKAVGRKANPGPLYGIKKDLWQALAVAVTFADTHESSPVSVEAGRER